VTLLNACIDAPEPVHIQIGVKEINAAGEHLSLITAPYLVREYGQGSLGVLGPMRMEYERAITAVAYVAHAFSEILSRT
jgi:heat-inducible transcriptional repressor